MALLSITYSTGFSSHRIVAGDFNNDTRLDVVVADYGTDNIMYFLDMIMELFLIETLIQLVIVLNHVG